MAPEDGVYSFAWSFLSSTGGTVYIAAVVDNQVQANTCTNEQKRTHIHTSGHLIYELKKMNKVWIRTWWQAATYMHADNFSHFSGYKISLSWKLLNFFQCICNRSKINNELQFCVCVFVSFLQTSKMWLGFKGLNASGHKSKLKNIQKQFFRFESYTKMWNHWMLFTRIR